MTPDERVLCKALRDEFRRRVVLMQPGFRFNDRDQLEHWLPAARLCTQAVSEPMEWIELGLRLAQQKANRLDPSMLAGLMPSQFGRSEISLLKATGSNVLTDNAERDFNEAWRLIFNRCGSTDLHNECAMTLLRLRISNLIRPYVRVLLAGNDPEVWHEFSWEAQVELRTSPNLKSQADQFTETALSTDEVLRRPCGPIPEMRLYEMRLRA